MIFHNDTSSTEIYTLSLHDALPICITTDWLFKESPSARDFFAGTDGPIPIATQGIHPAQIIAVVRSEEHTSELQSQSNLVCRLLLEKKKKNESTQLQRHYATRTQVC